MAHWGSVEDDSSQTRQYDEPANVSYSSNNSNSDQHRNNNNNNSNNNYNNSYDNPRDNNRYDRNHNNNRRNNDRGDRFNNSNNNRNNNRNRNSRGNDRNGQDRYEIIDDGKKYTGVIGKLLDSFGFIQCAEEMQEIFFHYSRLPCHPEDISIGSCVSYVAALDKRSQKLVATQIMILPPGSVTLEIIDTEESKGFVLSSIPTRHGGFGESDPAGFIEVIKTDECFRVEYTMLEQIEPHVQLRVGDEVKFKLCTDKRDGRRRAVSVELVARAKAKVFFGKIVSLKDSFGFIKREKDGNTSEIFFHFSNVNIDPNDLKMNDEVQFEETKRRNGLAATNVVVLPPDFFDDIQHEITCGVIVRMPARGRGYIEYTSVVPPAAVAVAAAAATSPLDVEEKETNDASADASEVPTASTTEESVVNDEDSAVVPTKTKEKRSKSGVRKERLAFDLKDVQEHVSVGDKIKFNICIDSRTMKALRGVNIHLDEKAHLTNLPPCKGIVLSLFESYGFLKCEGIDPKRKVIFHFKDVIKAEGTEDEKKEEEIDDENKLVAPCEIEDEFEFSLFKDRDLTTALALKPLPKNTISFETTSEETYRGTVQKQYQDKKRTHGGHNNNNNNNNSTNANGFSYVIVIDDPEDEGGDGKKNRLRLPFNDNEVSGDMILDLGDIVECRLSTDKFSREKRAVEISLIEKPRSRGYIAIVKKKKDHGFIEFVPLQTKPNYMPTNLPLMFFSMSEYQIPDPAILQQYSHKKTVLEEDDELPIQKEKDDIEVDVAGDTVEEATTTATQTTPTPRVGYEVDFRIQRNGNKPATLVDIRLLPKGTIQAIEEENEPEGGSSKENAADFYYGVIERAYLATPDRYGGTVRVELPPSQNNSNNTQGSSEGRAIVLPFGVSSFDHQAIPRKNECVGLKIRQGRATLLKPLYKSEDIKIEKRGVVVSYDGCRGVIKCSSDEAHGEKEEEDEEQVELYDFYRGQVLSNLTTKDATNVPVEFSLTKNLITHQMNAYRIRKVRQIQAGTCLVLREPSKPDGTIGFHLKRTVVCE